MDNNVSKECIKYKKMDISKEIDQYVTNHSNHFNKVIEYFKNLSLDDSVKQASLALTPNNNNKINMNSHQRRIGQEKCLAGYKELITYLDLIHASKTFEDIFGITELVRETIYGLGDLWSYDTALRIGFKKKTFPKGVYLQSGALIGAKKILNVKKINARYLSVSDFPMELQSLEPYQIENFLCVWSKALR